ncbi:MAG TPA: PKD domain-containing protein [Solirubrobacterales bacterium]
MFALAALSLVSAAGSALAADCDIDIRDGSDYLFDFNSEVSDPPRVAAAYGGVFEGEAPGGRDDSWDDWGGIFVAAPSADLAGLGVEDRYLGPNACEVVAGGREVRYPVVPMKGLEVQHAWFVDPGPLNGARILTVLRNPGAAPISVKLVQGFPLEGFRDEVDLGSDSGTVLAATSDGTRVATPTSTWGVTTDHEPLAGSIDFDPALAHVWDGPGGATRVAEVFAKTGDERLYWTWVATVPPGGTSSFISYEIQATVPDASAIAEVGQASAQAQARQAQGPASLYQGMSAAEIAGTMNWAHPAPTATIKSVAGANSGRPVLLDGSGSLGAAGLPQCGIVSYAWKADDGATATGPTFSHAFKPGAHKAMLTVTSTCGASTGAETSFVVAPSFKLGKVKLNRSKGTATVKVTTLAAGKLTLSGKGVKKVSKKLAKPGTVTLVVKPTGKVRKRLFARGDAKAKIVVSLTPASGAPTSLRKTLPLKLGD